MADITLDSITPEKTIARGTLITLYGLFSEELGRKFKVYVGPNGDNTDALCWSGIPGDPHFVTPNTFETLKFYLPDLEVGGPYDIFIEREDGLNTGLLSGVLTIVASPYYSEVFVTRSTLPPIFKLGPRNMSLLERIP